MSRLCANPRCPDGPADLDALRLRSDALYCGPSCKAAAHRLGAAKKTKARPKGKPPARPDAPAVAVRSRTQGTAKPGVSAYFKPGVAEALVAALEAQSWNGSAPTVRAAVDTLRTAINRHERRTREGSEEEPTCQDALPGVGWSQQEIAGAPALTGPRRGTEAR